jgi:hypothetical protein
MGDSKGMRITLFTFAQHHFPDFREMIDFGSGAISKIEDMMLNRC